MRRILAASFVLVLALALGLAPSASAGHTADTCSTSALFVNQDMGSSCPMILNCPATSLTCSWDLSVAASGVGYVRAYVSNLATGQKLVTCGPGSLTCSNTAPFHLSPTEVVNLECWLYGGEGSAALLASATCNATPTGHVG